MNDLTFNFKRRDVLKKESSYTNVPQGGTKDEDLDAWTEQQIATYPKITTEELAKIYGKTSKTIKRHIAKMPHIRFIGSEYSGY